MAHLSLDQLTTYRLVISRRSFTAAAEALGISQPAVSFQMRQLETALQTRLIERTGRGVRPTPAGLTLLAHCEEIEKAVSAAVQSVAMHKLDISGTVTLGTGATVCIHLLPAILQQLRKDYPQLSVGVRTGNTQDIVRGVGRTVSTSVLLPCPPSAGIWMLRRSWSMNSSLSRQNRPRASLALRRSNCR
jgi:DNA-binding transcriptional LysR family regulator